MSRFLLWVGLLAVCGAIGNAAMIFQAGGAAHNKSNWGIVAGYAAAGVVLMATGGAMYARKRTAPAPARNRPSTADGLYRLREMQAQAAELHRAATSMLEQAATIRRQAQDLAQQIRADVGQIIEE